MKKSLLYIGLLAAVMLVLASCNKPVDGSQGQTRVQKYSLRDTIALNGEKDGLMVFSFDFDVPMPSDGDTAAMEKIQREIQRELFADKFGELPFDSAMVAYRDFVADNYRIAFKHVAEQLVDEIQKGADTVLANPERATLDNELYITSGINFDSLGLLSYSVEQIINFGDATDISRVKYLNFSKSDGRVINEETLFVDGYERDMTNLLLNSMIEQTDDVELIKDLEDNDYEVQSIRPNDNFYFSSDGIVYLFNLVDIGPYIPEGTQVLIGWDKLALLLRPEWAYIAGK